MEKITRLRPQRVSDTIQATTTEVLSKIDIYSKFQGLVNKDPELFDCTADSFNLFINFTQTINSFFTPEITRAFVLKTDESFCMVDFSRNQRNIFTPYYAIKLENESFLLKEYSELDNFENFDPINTGNNVQIIDDLIEFLLTIKSSEDKTIWTDGVVFEKDDETTLTSLYHIYNPYLFISGISITSTDLLNEVNQMVMQRDASYAICNMENKIILESRYDHTQSYKFPLPYINETDFWSDFLKSFSFLDPTDMQKFEIYSKINGTQWAFIIDPLTLGNFGCLLYVAVNLNSSQGQILYYQSLIFIVSLVIICIIYVFNKCNNKIFKRKSKKNNRINICINDTHFNSLLNEYNIYYQSLSKLRNLELINADDVLLNKVIDSISTSITENPENLYSRKLKSECKFCMPFSNPKKSPVSKNLNVIYNNWVKSIPSDFKDYRFSGPFRFSEHEEAPIRKLIQLCTTMILKQHLLVVGFDPDTLFAFIVELSSKYIVDPIYTAFRIHWTFNFLCKNFNEWIYSVEDKLALLLTILLYDSNVPKDEATTENEFICEIYKFIRMNFHMYNNDTSATVKNINQIVCFVENRFGSESVPAKYILQRIADNLLWLYIPNSLELLGMFAVRIESPEFSVFNNLCDRTLFTKFIIAFSEYSCYFAPSRLMIWASQKAIEKYFTKEEMNDEKFVAEYHIEIISKVVRSWFTVIETFKPLDKCRINLDESEKYWRSKLQDVEED